MSSSTALKTNDIWSKTIGYDPYSSAEQNKDDAASQEHAASLLLLAKMSNLAGSESRGGCKRCGMLGHLTFQCRNAVQSAIKEEEVSSSSHIFINYQHILIPYTLIYCSLLLIQAMTTSQ